MSYPVTTPFGWVTGYPLNQTDPVNHPGQGFHNGIDYNYPTGTPVVVNGVTIGLSGATGYVTGPHLHVGRWLGGTVTDPAVGGGFNFNSAVVTQISSDPTNGNYVRVQGDGASWVYLHLSNNNLVTVGQVLSPQGEDMIPDLHHLDAVFQRFFGRNSTAAEQAEWIGKKGYTELIDVLQSQQAYKDQVHYSDVGFQTVTKGVTPLKSGLYQV